jgi:hypothetical protein
MSQSPHFAAAEAEERAHLLAEAEVRLRSTAVDENEAGVQDKGEEELAVQTTVLGDAGYADIPTIHPITNMPPTDYKINNKSWCTFLLSIKSSNEYSSRILDWADYHTPPDHFSDSLIDYFADRQAETTVVKGVEKCRYAASTLVSWYSMFKRFFNFAHDMDVDVECKIIGVWLKNWSKSQKVTKSKVFKKSEIGEFLQNNTAFLPNSI